MACATIGVPCARVGAGRGVWQYAPPAGREWRSGGATAHPAPRRSTVLANETLPRRAGPAPFGRRLLRQLLAVSLFYKVLLANGALVLGAALVGMALVDRVTRDRHPLAAWELAAYALGVAALSLLVNALVLRAAFLPLQG